MQWQRQVDDLVDCAAVGDFQRCGRSEIAGDIEHATVGHDPAGLVDGDLAETQELGVQLQLAESVQGVVEAEKALVHSTFGCADLLLKVLGFDEQPFVPNDRIT
ncbi:hypothetical protein D3C78_937580 [compost metagenome]